MPDPNAGPPTAVPPLGYRDLAWWPETADGLEGEELVIAFVEADKTAIVETEQQANSEGHQILLKGIRVVTTPPKTKPVEEILIKLKGETEPRPARINGIPCDAVFTTASAMRKFLLTYYDAQRLLDDAERATLVSIMSDPSVPAVGHVHPSVSAGIGIANQQTVGGS